MTACSCRASGNMPRGRNDLAPARPRTRKRRASRARRAPERVDSFRHESEHAGRRRYSSKEHRPFNAHDVLAAVAHEALVVAVAASNLAQGVQLTDTDHARLMQSASRLRQAAELANGRL